MFKEVDYSSRPLTECCKSTNQHKKWAELLNRGTNKVE